MQLEEILAQGLTSLDQVQAGHWVLISSSRSYSYYGTPKPVQVDRVTKTQIIINNTRYSRDGGQEIGGSKYASNRVQLCTPELILDIKIDHAKRTLRAMAEKVNREAGIVAGNASVTQATLDQVTQAYNQLSAVLATLGGGK